MRLDEVSAVDIREPLVVQRKSLLGLLGSLSEGQWAARTAAPDWSVKDVSLHLLDVDLSWLARGRDGDRSGIIAVPANHEAFVRGLAERNQRWVDGARALSPRLITDLLRWSGEELTRYLGSVELGQSSSVYWAGEVPLWFDLAREFTERWVHARQIREAALAGPGYRADDHLGLVIRTFIWAFPHQYTAAAQPGTVVALDIGGAGAWMLTRTGKGWILDEGRAPDPAATLRMTDDACWRLLAGAPYDPAQVQLSGRRDLAEPLKRVRGVIV